MIVRFLPSAEADLDEIYFAIAEHDEAAADRFVERLREASRRLRDFPRSAPLRPDVANDVHGLSIAGHILLYRVSGDTVMMVRVVRASRDLSSLKI